MTDSALLMNLNWLINMCLFILDLFIKTIRLPLYIILRFLFIKPFCPYFSNRFALGLSIILLLLSIVDGRFYSISLIISFHRRLTPNWWIVSKESLFFYMIFLRYLS